MGIIRIFLALSVVLAHSGALFNEFRLISGNLAVECFFIISGFYMALILEDKYKLNRKGYFLFISNRLLRLYPIYWAILLMSVSLLVISAIKNNNIQDIESFSKCNYASLLIVIFSNAMLLFQDILMFFHINTADGFLQFSQNSKLEALPSYKLLMVPQAWSLGIEISFYVIAPFINKLRNNWIFLIISLSLLLRYILYYNFNLTFDPWTYRFFPTEIVFFLIGILVFRFYFYRKKIMKINSFWAFSILLYLISIMIYFHKLPFTQTIFCSYSINDLLLFTSIIFTLPFLFHFFKDNNLDRQIGELSYPVYIAHIFIWLVVIRFLPSKSVYTSFFTILASLLLSIAINYFITSPIEKIRARRLLN
jgi:peptidoglycan/LPS O-acetylase OafA/YrhL